MIINKLFEFRDQAERLRLDLEVLLEQEIPGHQNRLRDEIKNIKQALDHSKIPERFSIAVVGTFKTGKSSFVNKLAGERLAGVETNPETAAISIFRYADTPRVEVNLITLEEWQRMEDLYDDAPKHPEAYRVAGLRGFNEQMAQRKNSEGKPIDFEAIDVESMVREWLKPKGHVHVIESEDWETKKGKQEFRKAIQQFTSSRNPLHYFVKELIVYAPVPLLRDHVELIDTPGLNDTQVYREQLTEERLAEVDAILFLTRSGASFSQFDKEFLVRQLRKKRLRHLRLIVTQVDTTVENARRDALEEDDDPPSIKEVQAKEEARLRSEISRTLDELLDETDLKDEEGYYYMEQLDALKIHFTSARWFDDGQHEESGILAVREALFEVLSENYRIKQLVDHLNHVTAAVRGRLTNFFDERRSVLEAEFDLSKVKNNIEGLEKHLALLMDQFQKNMQELISTHNRDQEALTDLIEANVARMQLQAKEVLSIYEKTDIAKHWKTRRHGYWGYLNEMGARVADKIFPVMEHTLNKQLKPFTEFIDLSSKSIDSLQGKIEGLEADSTVEGLPKIEFGETKQRFMEEYVSELNSRVVHEKDTIIQLLEEFATSELKTKLNDAKDYVADVLGTGTTIRQNGIVSEFYSDIRKSITAALECFLKSRFFGFKSSLNKGAESLFPKLRTSIENLLTNRKQLIEEHLKIQTGEARERLERYLETGLQVLEGKHLVGDQADATMKSLEEKVLNIPEGATGYSYEAILGPYLESAEHIGMKEPYLRFHYQLDNFQRFCELASRSGTTRTIDLLTGDLSSEDKDKSDSRLEDIRRLLEPYKITLKWQRDSSLHAREIKVDDKWVILSDRGLDIYKKTESRNDFGQFDLSLRRCKQTQVHIRRTI